MSQMPSPIRPVEKAAVNSAAITAFVLSVLGCVGWMALCVLLLPYEENSGGNGVKAVSNVLTFGLNFFLLVAGSAISGTLSFSGLLAGAVSLGNATDRMGYAAVALGVIGLLGGALLVIWRFNLVFG